MTISCENIVVNSKPKIDVDVMQETLLGKTINEPISEIIKTISQPHLDAKIYSKSENKKVKELDMHLFPKISSCYEQLLDFYNSKFKTNLTDTILNTWQSDSTEFILYKNSDSSILVNIYKRK